MIVVSFDQGSQLGGISKGGQCAIDETNDFGQTDLMRRSPQAVAAFGTA